MERFDAMERQHIHHTKIERLMSRVEQRNFLNQLLGSGVDEQGKTAANAAAGTGKADFASAEDG